MEGNDITTGYCPHCNHRLNKAAAIDDDAKPEEGNIGLCFYCGGIIQYTKNGIEKVDDLVLDILGVLQPDFYDQLIKAQKQLRNET